jgi:hypothetical protein
MVAAGRSAAWLAGCIRIAARDAHAQLCVGSAGVVNHHFDPSPLPSNERTMVMLTGSCLCGGVAYEVDAAVGPIAHCHCATCRKAHGSAFSSVSSVPRDKFRWTKGANLLASYESSPGKVRRFCSKCGSQIVAERAGQSTVILRLGCVDTPITDRPKAHIWRSQGASWFDPKDPLPELPEGFA